MFAWHETTRRTVCRAAFLAICIAPTLIVVGWCVARGLPTHRARAEAELGAALGLTVSLEGIEHLRPDQVRYTGLVLSDPETGARLLHAESAELRRDEAGLSIVAVRPELFAAAAEQGRELLARLLRKVAARPAAVDLSAAELRLTLAAPRAESRRLRDVELRIADVKQGSLVQARFYVVGAEANEPVQIRWWRTIAEAANTPAVAATKPPAATTCELNTAGAAIPCDVLGQFFGLPLDLGMEATFRGYVGASDEGGAWRGVARGWLSSVDLERMFVDLAPHRLSGRGQLQLAAAEFQAGRLTSARGVFTAGPGEANSPLLASASRSLGLRSALPRFDAEQYDYDQLAFDFDLSAQGVTIRGRCPGANGAIMTSRGQAILAEKDRPETPEPIAHVLRALTPPGALEAPLTPHTAWLARRLPISERR